VNIHGRYVLLYHKLLDSPIFASEPLLKLAVWCLLKANRYPHTTAMKTGKGETLVSLKPGQLVFGRHTAAQELGMKGTTIRCRMLKLKELGFLDMQSDTHYSVITIAKWGEYQIPPDEVDRQVDTQLTTNCQPTDNQLTHSRGIDRHKDKGIKNPPTPQGGIALELAKLLLESVEKAEGRKLTTKPSAGTAPITALLKDVTEDDIRNTIAWLCSENLARDYRFAVQSGKALREKWDRIQAAMNRKDDGHDPRSKTNRGVNRASDYAGC